MQPGALLNSCVCRHRIRQPIIISCSCSHPLDNACAGGVLTLYTMPYSCRFHEVVTLFRLLQFFDRSSSSVIIDVWYWWMQCWVIPSNTASCLHISFLARLPGALLCPEVRQGKRDQMVQCWLPIDLEVWLPTDVRMGCHLLQAIMAALYLQGKCHGRVPAVADIAAKCTQTSGAVPENNITPCWSCYFAYYVHWMPDRSSAAIAVWAKKTADYHMQ